MDDQTELEGMFESLSNSEKMILLDGMTFGLGFVGIVIRDNKLCDEELFKQQASKVMTGIRIGILHDGWGLHKSIQVIYGLLYDHNIVQSDKDGNNKWPFSDE